MTMTHRWGSVLLIALLGTACAGPTPSTVPTRGGEPAAGEALPQRTAQSKALVTAVRYEPVSLASKPLRATGSSVDHTIRLFNAELVLRDARDTARPYLAEA